MVMRMVIHSFTYCAGIDGHAVILVVDSGTRDVDTGARSDIKGVCVVGTSIIAFGVIDGHTGDGQIGSAVDTEHLDWRVLELEAVNC